MSGNEPPEGWLDCPALGDVVEGTKFIPFKTPLCADFDRYIPPDKRFHPSALFSLPTGIKIGLIVDLTKTDRYYSPTEMTQFGCKVSKIECEGYAEVPNEENRATFISICRNFWATHPELYIGVHCTHGFNRTGFMIACYIVEELDSDITWALSCFAKSRPPGIYKSHYIDDICKLYGEDPSQLDHPGVPHWRRGAQISSVKRTASYSFTNDDENEFVTQSDGHASRRLRLSEACIDGVPQANVVSDETKYMLRQKIEEWTHRKGFPGSQPVSLDSKNIRYLDRDDYMVSWKADGTRYLAIILREQFFLYGRDEIIFEVPGFIFPQRKNPDNLVTDTLIDGELVMDNVGDKLVPRFLIFDILFFQNQNFGNSPFKIRYNAIKKELIDPREEMKKKPENRHSFANEAFSIRLKPFFPLFDSRKVLYMELPHERDGLLFNPPGPYEYGRCDKILKWKPPELNTVDFLLHVEWRRLPNCPPERRASLMYLDGGENIECSPITFPENEMYEKLNGKIIECYYDMEAKRWVYWKTRTDKTHPNAKATVQGVWASIKDNITEEILLEYIAKIESKRAASHPAHSNPHIMNSYSSSSSSSFSS